jgi:pimeloyl-ACP methyl ester carboxylesterase
LRFLPALVGLAACHPGIVDDHFDVLTDGAVIPVEVHGNIDGGTLLLVESGGPSGPGIVQRDVGYMPFADTLEPELAVALYDRRGTGTVEGDYGPADQSIDQLEADLDAVLSVLRSRYEPRHLVLMGHSFGTYSSGVYVLDHPGVADAWIAAAPAFIEGPDDLYVPYRRDFACRVAQGRIALGDANALWTEIEAFCDQYPSFPADREAPGVDELWSYLGRIEDRIEPSPSLAPGGLLEAVFLSHYNLIDTQLRSNLVSEAIEADPGREDLLPEVGAIEVPVAVVTGEYDGTTPTEMGQALADGVGGALTEIPRAGHYMMADQPDDFATVVLGVVDGL